MKLLLVFPILLPLLMGVLMTLGWRRRALQRVLSVVGSALLFAASIALFREVWAHGILVMQVGGWPAPYGITLVADTLSASMVVVASFVSLCVSLYILGTVDVRRERNGFHPLMQILMMGVCGSFLTGDLFNLFVWFEVMLIASFVLLALGGERQQIVGAMKYVTINLVASAIFLSALGILYGMVGTLNMADLSAKLANVAEPAPITVVAMLFFVAFGIKAAMFPLFFWLPASYHTPPIAVSAIFAGLLTKVGVYALLRTFTLIFVQEPAFTHSMILMLSVMTMIFGALGAIPQTDLRKVFSFLLISHIGYMTLGLGLFSAAGLAAAIFYLFHHMLVKTNLFLICGLVARAGGGYDLRRLGGLYRFRPGLSALFFVSALALAGIPPLSGFFGKYVVVRAALEHHAYLATGVVLLTSLLTLWVLARVWLRAFWEELPERGTIMKPSNSLILRCYIPVTLLALATVSFAFLASPIYAVAERSAWELMNPGSYLDAVGVVRP